MMVFKTIEEALQAGYKYVLTSVDGKYQNSFWTNKKAATAALDTIQYRQKGLFCTLVLITHQDLDD